MHAGVARVRAAVHAQAAVLITKKVSVMLASGVRAQRRATIIWRVAVAMAACVALAATVAPLGAAAYPDKGGGGPLVHGYLPYTEGPTLHPDRLDEIAARAAAEPALHPDRVDEIAGRTAYYLAYHEGPTLHPDRLDEIAARTAAEPALHPDRTDEMAGRR